jgi:sugar lactone lactonase YvrE
MAWSINGRQFYLSHSYQREIFVFPYEKGHLGARQRFARLPAALGIPDGAAIDTEGGYWCACHGGGRLRRYNSDGSVDREIALPVSQPTMCAFAGEQLDMLYVTSAADGLTSQQLRQEPLAGALFRVRPGQQGIARRCTL